MLLYLYNACFLAKDWLANALCDGELRQLRAKACGHQNDHHGVEITTSAFVAPARAESFIKDREALNDAIRSHDAERTERAWDRFIRWTYCIAPNGDSNVGE